MSSDTLFLISFALLGGGLPPFLWLLFWLREDKKHPEPKPLVLATFVGGMIAVPIALFIEKQLVVLPFGDIFNTINLELFIALVAIVSVEEIVKYGAARSVAFSNKYFDEPIDAMIYLISAALGFAALENTLFLIDGLSHSALLPGDYAGIARSGINEILINNNLRFIGANVLHTVASGLLGVMLGLSFYRHGFIKAMAFAGGLLIAIFLHAVFNFSIITFSDRPLVVFANLWLVAILLIFLFERVKKVAP